MHFMYFLLRLLPLLSLSFLGWCHKSKHLRNSEVYGSSKMFLCIFPLFILLFFYISYRKVFFIFIHITHMISIAMYLYFFLYIFFFTSIFLLFLVCFLQRNFFLNGFDFYFMVLFYSSTIPFHFYIVQYTTTWKEMLEPKRLRGFSFIHKYFYDFNPLDLQLPSSYLIFIHLTALRCF